MSDLANIDSFDYLLKIVVIGGNYDQTQIQGSAKLTYSPGLLPMSSVMNPNPQLGFSLLPKLFSSTPKE